MTMSLLSGLGSLVTAVSRHTIRAGAGSFFPQVMLLVVTVNPRRAACLRDTGGLCGMLSGR